jgi:hypothetical protein
MKSPLFSFKTNTGRASRLAALLALTLALSAMATTYCSVGNVTPSLTTS